MRAGNMCARLGLIGILVLAGCGNVSSKPSRLSSFPLRPRSLGLDSQQEQKPPASPLATSPALSLYGGARPATRQMASRDQPSRQSLYEAYNLLHTLAKDFHKPIEAPAVLVVGHQTAGKSALVEALMGFQFNQVGGGTKTRRPIALHMRYNAACSQPICYLTNDAGVEERKTLDEIQQYIESENRRLEADPTRCFDHREIVVRVEYRYCPNMVMIDTPGLISQRNTGGARTLNTQERALAQASKEAENLVLTKMQCPEYIILCIEDTTDWKHASARSLVEQADPNLSRTVIVNTKLDTKLLQFSVAEDVQDFISAEILHKLYPQMLGGPFYTSVPAGRVGRSTSHEFRTNEMFVQQLRRRERADRAILVSKLGPSQSKPLTHHLGVRKLRKFLEKRVEECYRRNVARIVPLLQNELRATEHQLASTSSELDALSVDSLKQTANQFREHFSRALSATIQGTIEAPVSVFGETLEMEQLRGGSFFNTRPAGPDTWPGLSAGSHAPTMHSLTPEAWNRVVEQQVGSANARLYGGSQYHRALREFALAVQNMALPEVTEDEIANAGGINDIHDGTNFMRAACVIAVDKAQASFEPLLQALRHRAMHVMKRLFPIALYMLESRGVSHTGAHHQAFTEAVRRIYEEFVDQTMKSCMERCQDDLMGMTRFVTWDLKERGSLAVQSALPTNEMVRVYTMTMKKKNGKQQQPQQQRSRGSDDSKSSRIVDEWESAMGGSDGALMSGGGRDHKALHGSRDDFAVAQSNREYRDQRDLLNLMEQVACMQDGNRTYAVVSALVQHIVQAWRMSFAQNVAMKFNCFFLLPFLDKFPFYLRNQLDRVYDGDLSHLFDIREARTDLELRLDELHNECRANKKLQGKFEAINQQLGRVEELWDEPSDSEGHGSIGQAEYYADDEDDDDGGGDGGGGGSRGDGGSSGGVGGGGGSTSSSGSIGGGGGGVGGATAPPPAGGYGAGFNGGVGSGDSQPNLSQDLPPAAPASSKPDDRVAVNRMTGYLTSWGVRRRIQWRGRQWRFPAEPFPGSAPGRTREQQT